MENRRFLPVIVVLLIAVILLIYLSSSIFYTIRPGERAVLFYKFGRGMDKENIQMPGFHVKAPYNELFVYDAASSM